MSALTEATVIVEAGNTSGNAYTGTARTTTATQAAYSRQLLPEIQN